MKEKKPGGTRPEMGTPEYEEWRKEVLKRRRKRQLKERRKRLAIITAAMIVAVGASVGVGALKGRSEKASKEKMVSSYFQCFCYLYLYIFNADCFSYTRCARDLSAYTKKERRVL